MRSPTSSVVNGVLISVLVGVAAGAAVFAISRTLPASYAGRVTLYAATPPSSGVADAEPPLDALQIYAVGTTTASVLQPIASEAGTTIEELRRRLRVETQPAPGPTTGLVIVRATAASPGAAADLANDVADRLTAWDAERAASRRAASMDVLAARISGLDERLSDLASGGSLEATDLEERARLASSRAEAAAMRSELGALPARSRLEVFEAARPTDDPVAPDPVRNGLVAFAIATFAIYALLVARRLDVTSRG